MTAGTSLRVRVRAARLGQGPSLRWPRERTAPKWNKTAAAERSSDGLHGGAGLCCREGGAQRPGPGLGEAGSGGSGPDPGGPPAALLRCPLGAPGWRGGRDTLLGAPGPAFLLPQPLLLLTPLSPPLSFIQVATPAFPLLGCLDHFVYFLESPAFCFSSRHRQTSWALRDHPLWCPVLGHKVGQSMTFRMGGEPPRCFQGLPPSPLGQGSPCTELPHRQVTQGTQSSRPPAPLLDTQAPRVVRWGSVPP